MKTELHELIQRCGLSIPGAARLCDVRLDTMKSWVYGRNATPEPVLAQLRDYARAAETIFAA